ncbi:MAG: glucose 1-dehydrogenase [Candidatus Heimdallarchaeota archaeon]
MKKLKEKVAIVTGGASGIGKATVRLFIEQGAYVVIADILDEMGYRVAEELGTNVTYHHTDVSQEADIKAVIGHTLETFGRLDCIFNNAGIVGVDGAIESIPVKGFDQTIGVLLRGVFLGMKHAAAVMKHQCSGSIINNASVAGLRTGYAPHIYSAAKAAVIHLTRSVAMELGECGVRVNCICPGYVVTPIIGRSYNLPLEAIDLTIERLKPVFANYQPIRRAGLPEDVAQAALWLASDDSSFVNGHVLIVDGGLSNGRMWSNRLSENDQLQAILGIDS